MAKPEFTEKRTCGHCGNHGPMTVLFSHEDAQGNEDVDSSMPLFEYGDFYELLKCQSCDKLELRSCPYHDALSDHEAGPPKYETHFPEERPIPEGLPKKVKAEYVKAMRARHGDSNGYAVLLGRVLEAVCHDKKAAGKMLGSQLENLAAKNLLPKEIIAFAKHLNNLRVAGAHFNVGNLTKKEIPIMERLIRAILEYVYTAPHIMKQAERTLKKLEKRKPQNSKDAAPSDLSSVILNLIDKANESPSSLSEALKKANMKFVGPTWI